MPRQYFTFTWSYGPVTLLLLPLLDVHRLVVSPCTSPLSLGVHVASTLSLWLELALGRKNVLIFLRNESFIFLAYLLV